MPYSLDGSVNPAAPEWMDAQAVPDGENGAQPPSPEDPGEDGVDWDALERDIDDLLNVDAYALDDLWDVEEPAQAVAGEPLQDAPGAEGEADGPGAAAPIAGAALQALLLRLLDPQEGPPGLLDLDPSGLRPAALYGQMWVPDSAWFHPT